MNTRQNRLIIYHDKYSQINKIQKFPSEVFKDEFGIQTNKQKKIYRTNKNYIQFYER